MELKDGYKQTEVGVIPQDWEVENISKNSTLKARIGWQGLTTKEYLTTGEYYLITGTDFEDGGIKWNTCHFVEKQRYDQDRNIQIKNDDILVTKDGTIGKVAFIERFSNKATLNSGVFVIRPKNNVYLPKYFFYILRSAYFDSFLSQLAAGSTISHLYQKDFIKFSFPLPPSVSEQKAIAQALSDTDALINALDVLIQKKRLIKQGTMQQLLTGKKRLKGFNGEWVTKTLGEIGDFKNGINKGKEDFGFGYPFVNLMDVFGASDLSNPSVFGLINSNEIEKKVYNLKKGDVLFIRSSVKPEGVGLTAVIKNDLMNTVYSGFLIRFRDNGFLDLNFKKYCFSEERFRNKIISSSTVSANTNINQDSLKNIEISIPPSVPEQKAIAEILSDMDNEITALETKRDKYKTIKQGMMQELLTGKTRLI